MKSRGKPAAPPEDVRRKLLDALAASIAEKGYHDSTVADIVRIAKMSRRAFYKHFTSKQDCYVALLSRVNADLIHHIETAVNRQSSWRDQVRQAVEAWLQAAQANPEITVSWIRDSPGLGEARRRLQQDELQRFQTLINNLLDNPHVRSESIPSPSPHAAVVLVGGLRELIATQVEHNLPVTDLADSAVAITVAILSAPQPAPAPSPSAHQRRRNEPLHS
jgi:AcrR family transcriptional regulator